ncbi:MAG: glutamine--fructose-6-phosphate transaminase (isomerizing) [Candidatus Methylomirabilis oxygeniifera]|uniref:Glutamine--fructose-6-phosphate aminotransferase [isomerizing] n=1 Tax=Methylomirabilis oxygeniifera TaxID=671143 RepID=D5MH10_METO1|nr:MAG: glutamine--fructose-6-phosphate transaminase (isomerizing) [Candidatus Methylomirabilis oxyfera]CBE69041.1 L-glutamine:D-fructose-6-phosphate aminotransferase [Candidatus Methylomirabilis oxyfera]
MCGIVGYVGHKKVVPVLLEGLKRLEYRGYDSAGLAILQQDRIALYRSVGKIKELENALWGRDLSGEIGLGHTRWATHGRPTENNAHPHSDCTGDLVVVHNGIIENYLALKAKLQQEGHHFTSDTDTEVIAHLIETQLRDTTDLELAVRRALTDVVGTYALGILWRGDPHRLVAARNGSPLVVGLGNGEFLIASDLPAILSHTRDVLFLDDQEMVVLSHDGVNVTTLAGEPVEKKVEKILWTPLMAEKSGYKHFMLKEIYEQPRAIRDTIRGRFSLESGQLYLEGLQAVDSTLPAIDRIVLVACGTSWHAGLVGKFLIEDLARISVEVDYGSEFRYRDPILDGRTLVVALSQSGETLDTLVSMREARRRGCQSLAICNVVGSTLSRESDGVLYTHAGPEIGVASTKAFTSQLVALYLLALALGRARGRLDGARTQELLSELIRLPHQMEQVLSLGPTLEGLAGHFHTASNFLYLGRGINYPIALEGALKLKEISYIHAEGYPAGEMKHGPIALITEEMPVVVLAPKDKTFEKVLSNIEEVKTRNGIVVALSDETDARVLAKADHLISIPHTSLHLMPLLLVVPLQLLAYHIAVRKGCDVDQPRNLAKSVTVE